MKNLLILPSIAVLLFTSLSSCKKEAANTSPVQPLEKGAVADLVKGSEIGISTAGPYEIGLWFKTTVKGSIKSLIVNLPVAKEQLVTLWRVADKSIIASTQVNCTSTDNWNNIAQVDIPVEADTEYILSTNASTFYGCNLTNESFPYKTGHIILLGYTVNQGSEQIFPSIPVGNVAAGFADFSFQPAQ